MYLNDKIKSDKNYKESIVLDIFSYHGIHSRTPLPTSRCDSAIEKMDSTQNVEFDNGRVSYCINSRAVLWLLGKVPVKLCEFILSKLASSQKEMREVHLRDNENS